MLLCSEFTLPETSAWLHVHYQYATVDCTGVPLFYESRTLSSAVYEACAHESTHEAKLVSINRLYSHKDFLKDRQVKIEQANAKLDGQFT